MSAVQFKQVNYCEGWLFFFFFFFLTYLLVDPFLKHFTKVTSDCFEMDCSLKSVQYTSIYSMLKNMKNYKDGAISQLEPHKLNFWQDF